MTVITTVKPSQEEMRHGHFEDPWIYRGGVALPGAQVVPRGARSAGQGRRAAGAARELAPERGLRLRALDLQCEPERVRLRALDLRPGLAIRGERRRERRAHDRCLAGRDVDRNVARRERLPRISREIMRAACELPAARE